MSVRQSEGRLKRLLDDFPALHVIRFENRLWASKKIAMPKTEVHVQVADPASMHLAADNIDIFGRSYLINKDLRGTREEYMVAVGHFGQILARLEWKRGDFFKGKMSKDIFKMVDPSEVSYLVWVSVFGWYKNPSEEQKLISDRLFGEKVSADLHMIVFRKPKGRTFAEIIEIADKEKKEREEAYKYLPKNMPELAGIHKALRDGCRLHAFSSGGGLRVVGISKGGKETAYGEHPHVEEAFLHADEDYLAGGRKYNEVYGKKYPHYLTGESISTSNIDFWIRKGNKFDCWFDGVLFVFELKGYSHTEIPEFVLAKLEDPMNEAGVFWEKRGYTYHSWKSKFANGDPCTSTEVAKEPSGDRSGTDAWMYEITKTGIGGTIWQAMKAAFEAPEVELKKK